MRCYVEDIYSGTYKDFHGHSTATACKHQIQVNSFFKTRSSIYVKLLIIKGEKTTLETMFG